MGQFSQFVQKPAPVPPVVTTSAPTSAYKHIDPDYIRDDPVLGVAGQQMIYRKKGTWIGVEVVHDFHPVRPKYTAYPIEFTGDDEITNFQRTANLAPFTAANEEDLQAKLQALL